MEKSQDEDVQVILPNDVLQIKGDKWIYHGRDLTENEIKELKSQAKVMRSMQLWKMMVSDSRYHLQYRAINAQNNEELKKIQEHHSVLVFYEKFIYNTENK